MSKSSFLERITQTVAPVVEGLGYDLVRVLLVGSGKPTLQIMAEWPDGKMGVEDCEAISKAVSAVLDVENVLDGAYYLEVSSPGIDRPLTRLKDFSNYEGFEARIEMQTAQKGQKKFKGKILSLEKEDVRLQDEGGVVHILPFHDITRAKLVLTDDLIEAVTRKQGS